MLLSLSIKVSLKGFFVATRSVLGALAISFSFWVRAADPIVIYQTGWEATPATPAWAPGTVAPQNGWSSYPSPLAHSVVVNGSSNATVSGQAVITPYGNQFHRFLASSGSNNVVGFAWPDITAALAGLPANYKIFKASLDVFAPAAQASVAAAYGIVGIHDNGAAVPWGVLIDPSDPSVNLLIDDQAGDLSQAVFDAFKTNTWFNVEITANYASGQISIAVNGTNLPSLTQTSSEISLGSLTDIDIVAWNWNETAPPLRSIFSDNFRITAEAVEPPRPKLKIAQNPEGDWTLSWDATFSDWNLESAPAANGPWAFVDTPFISNGTAYVLVANQPPRTFFRLHKP